jgi:hypothetical protein
MRLTSNLILKGLLGSKPFLGQAARNFTLIVSYWLVPGIDSGVCL